MEFRQFCCNRLGKSYRHVGDRVSGISGDLLSVETDRRVPVGRGICSFDGDKYTLYQDSDHRIIEHTFRHGGGVCGADFFCGDRRAAHHANADEDVEADRTHTGIVLVRIGFLFILRFDLARGSGTVRIGGRNGYCHFRGSRGYLHTAVEKGEQNVSTFLRLDKLSVGYDGKTLIHDIELDLKKGQILSLIGPNGSGKSTILKSITKHLSLIAGTVYLDEKDFHKISCRESARKLAVVLTERIHPELMTCRDVVETGRYPYTNSFGKMTPEDDRIVEESLCRVHAQEIASQPFNACSDGQKQRILLARAICQQPQVIVLDEPTSFLDIRYKLELLNTLREMAEDGVTIILSLHEIDLAAKISDYVLCIKGDTIFRSGTPEEIFSREIIEELYDLNSHCYDTDFGSAELARPCGEPKVFVVHNPGDIGMYRALQKRGIAFSAGILWENDADKHVADALAYHTVSERAFKPVSEATYAEAVKEMLSCGRVLVRKTPEGVWNEANRRLLARAKEESVPIFTQTEQL